MKQLWNDRYGSEAYYYGKEPNAFFATQLKMAKPGNILLPGEGEGRNAVYAALKGWSVDAFDQSEAGRQKAFSLAQERGVQINYDVCQTEDFLFKPDHYDVAALIYFHVDGPARENLHQQVYKSLKPGGTLFLEAFHKEQMNYNTGGPKSVQMLFDEALLSSDFALLETVLLEKQIIILNEGSFHQGEASIMRFVGIKPQ